MANSITNVGFSDYTSEQADIERRRKMAELLQQQGQTPMGPTESVGGWAIQKSPLEGLGKMLQSYSGAKGQKQATEEEKALGRKYQSDLARTLMEAQTAGTGKPAQDNPAIDDPAAGQYAPASVSPAVAPDRQMMARILMGHPATQQLGLQGMQQDMQRQSFMGATPAASGAVSSGAVGGQPQPQGTAPQAPPGVPQQAIGGPAGGIPMQNWLAGSDVNAGYMKYLEQLAKDYEKNTQPQNVRPGGTVAIPDGKGGYRQAYYSAPLGEGMTRDPAGNASVVPGYPEGQIALGKAPLEKVQNPDQTFSYVPRSQLAAAASANPIPQAPPVPPRGPSPAGFPRETPADLRKSGTDALPILQAEAATFTQRGQPVPPDLQREIQQAQTRAGGAYPKAANPAPTGGGLAATPQAGPPRFGQTQEEQIRQQRETAAGKEVDQTFAKDYVAFTTGGAQDAAKQISQLGDVVKQLGTPGAKLTGPFIGGVPDALLKFNKTGQNAIAMRERVEEVVQRSLRAILGAQFTEKEGERLIARAYNPNLSEKENAVRVGRLATQLQQAFSAKQDAANYFQKNNTLQGWQGKMPTMSDFDPDVQKSSGQVGKTPISQATRDFLKAQGITVD